MSVSRHCSIYKASDEKWYMELAHQEYEGQEDAYTYGPFSTEQEVEDYLNHYSNPGGMNYDNSGTEPPPTISPNGEPVQAPKPSGPYRVHYRGFRTYGRGF